MSESKQLAEYTLDEISKKNENSTVQWIHVEGLVVDVTQYKTIHPGGPDILLENAGSDSTEAFINTGHTKEAKQKLLEYVIGKVKGYNKPKNSIFDVSEKSIKVETNEPQNGGKAVLLFIPLLILLLAIIFNIF